MSTANCSPSANQRGISDKRGGVDSRFRSQAANSQSVECVQFKTFIVPDLFENAEASTLIIVFLIFGHI
jgi:hypothetical protein